MVIGEYLPFVVTEVTDGSDLVAVCESGELM